MFNNENNRRYISWGLTALAVVAASLLLSSLLGNLDWVGGFISSILDVLMPVIYGFVMAFLMAPAYNLFVQKLSELFRRSGKKGAFPAGPGDAAARFLATLLCIIVILAVVTALTAMLIPQIISGVVELSNSLPKNTASVEALIRGLFRGESSAAEGVMLELFDQLYAAMWGWISADFLPNINKYLSQMTTGVVKILSVLKNFFIGLIIMAYGLNMKELLSAQTKKMLYALLPLSAANDLISEARYVKTVFSNFIIGKLIDSFIIAVICYVCMSVMKMPYTLLISVFVGVTNVIPFFGPFIGAIPSAFILLMISPMRALQFLIFILILQQFDGNILGPRILGSTTGVSSFWVLFSILFFGGIWGIVGMVVGIPTFAVLSRFVRRMLNGLLKKKSLSASTGDYGGLERIESGGEEGPRYCYRDVCNRRKIKI